MADIISKDRKRVDRAATAGVSGQGQVAASSSVDPSALAPTASLTRHASLLELVEMLFFAYRDFTGEADVVLQTYDLGRAHHRVLHFVNRCPGIRVADLLELLKITKQSLGRVLRKLVADGWIEQVPGPEDRRERRLTLTESGRVLAGRLAELQARRIESALRESEQVPDGDQVSDGEQPSGSHAPEIVRNFLFAMIAREERAAVSALVHRVDGTARTEPEPAKQ